MPRDDVKLRADTAVLDKQWLNANREFALSIRKGPVATGLGSMKGVVGRFVATRDALPGMSPEAAKGFVGVLKAHPAMRLKTRSEVALRLTREEQTWSGGLIVSGALALGQQGNRDRRLVDALVSVALGGANRSDLLTRFVLTGGKGITGKLRLDDTLLDDLGDLLKKYKIRDLRGTECLMQLTNAVSNLSQAASGEPPAPPNLNPVTACTPDHGRPGTRVVLTGTGWPMTPPADVEVVFTSQAGGPIVAEIDFWGPTKPGLTLEVAVRVPAGVGTGPVGFRTTAVAGMPSAAIELAAVMEHCLGGRTKLSQALAHWAPPLAKTYVPKGATFTGEPRLTAVQPLTGHEGDILTVAGVGFAAGDAVSVGGSWSPTTCVSATELQAPIPNISGGTAMVYAALPTVAHQTGSVSVQVLPTLTSLSVASADVNDLVQANGTGFHPLTVMTIDGYSVQTTFLSYHAVMFRVHRPPHPVARVPGGELVHVRAINPGNATVGPLDLVIRDESIVVTHTDGPMTMSATITPPPEACSPPAPMFSPPAGFLDPANQAGRLSATLCAQAKRKQEPTVMLAHAAESYYWAAHPAAPPDKTLALANALADLAVTGRTAYSTFKATGVDEAALNVAALGLVPNADPADMAAAVTQALNRAYTVAWALRGPVAHRRAVRPGLGWIAVSGEDDPPHRPVNETDISPFEQYEIDVTTPTPAASPPSSKTLKVRFYIASTVPAPAGPGPASRALPPDPVPHIPEGHRVILFLHGHSSSADEALGLIPHIHQAGLARSTKFSVVTLDLPNSGYSEMFDQTEVAPIAGTSWPGGVTDHTLLRTPALDFLEDHVIAFVDALDAVAPFKGRFAGVIGGSLGGNLGLRLGRRDAMPSPPSPVVPPSPWLQAGIVAWSPASVWAPKVSNVALSIAPAHGFTRMQWPESPQARWDYFDEVFDSPMWPLGPSQPETWYLKGWPCQPLYLESARRARHEIYNEHFRLWHWRLVCEQLIFSHFDTIDHEDPNGPFKYAFNTIRMLLLAGADDDYKGAKIFSSTQTLADRMPNALGRSVFLDQTGHSIQFERPHFLGDQIAGFLA